MSGRNITVRYKKLSSSFFKHKGPLVPIFTIPSRALPISINYYIYNTCILTSNMINTIIKC